MTKAKVRQFKLIEKVQMNIRFIQKEVIFNKNLYQETMIL